MIDREDLLLLGRNHVRYGTYELRSLGASVACTISVGGDHHSPSLQFKADPEIPNEDGLLIVTRGNRRLLAVADAHFGHESSHTILEGLRGVVGKEGIPADRHALQRAVLQIPADAELPASDSETSLLIVVHDVSSGAGFGISYGDSSCVVVDAGGAARRLNFRTTVYVSPHQSYAWNWEAATGFDFQTDPGQLVCLFTDGIDECHYRHPDTSVTPAIMGRLLLESGLDPATGAARVTECALEGVDGNPGGQDNIALIVVATR